MQFSNINEFFAMGGYGFYVWLSFGISFLVLIGLWGLSYWQHKQLFFVANKELLRAERIKAARKAKRASTEQNNQEQPLSSME